MTTKTKAAHTPGPWMLTGEIDRIHSGEVICPGKHESPVAVCCDFNRYEREEEREANARLIAAAPDLLAACKAFADAMRRNEFPDMMLLVEALQLASVAIARAEARQ